MGSLGMGWARRALVFRVVLVVAAVAAGGGLALAFGLPESEAKGYSAYDDPQKPVLSYVLSKDQNVEEFQNEFGLDDEKMQEILAVVHEGDEALTEEYEESEQIVESDGGASETKIEGRIAASDFDEKVSQAVARTKSEVGGLLPKGRADELGPWVDEQWRAETAAASETTYQGASRRGITCKVYTSLYNGFSRYEVALPHKRVKFSGGKRVRIKAVRGGRKVGAPVKEAGPWNIRDDYWRASRDRSMWRRLPRCVPQAQAAFFRDFNRGKDQYGREVLNPAGLDITLAVARRMNVKQRIQRQGLIRVRVFFPWVQR